MSDGEIKCYTCKHRGHPVADMDVYGHEPEQCSMCDNAWLGWEPFDDEEEDDDDAEEV